MAEFNILGFFYINFINNWTKLDFCMNIKPETSEITAKKIILDTREAVEQVK